MKTILEGNLFKNGQLKVEYTPDFARESLIEKDDYVNSDGVSGNCKTIYLDGVIIEIKNVSVQRPYEVKVQHDFSLNKIHFEIVGNNVYTPNKNTNGVNINIPQGHYNFFFLPEVNGILQYNCNQRKTLEIKFSDAYLKKIMGNELKDTSLDFSQSVYNRSPFVMWEKSAPISADLQHLIDEITKCNYSGNLKKVYLEAKVMELLAILQVKLKERKTLKNNVDKNEIERIVQLGQFIENNLNKNLTIPYLSTVVGMNTSKLKQQFKLIFNTTIFKYITDVRMKKAKQLILSKEAKIASISQEVGYKNPQHFTVAFKKKFGYLPSELLK